MGDYLDLQAPQWVDFTETRSPIQMQDFFEKSHAMHEHIDNFCDTISENIENIQLMSNTDVICASTEVQADLEIIKSTPIKIASPKHELEETTYDQVFNDAMRQWELCSKPLKTRAALNKTTMQTVFTTPNMSKTVKLSKSIGCRSVPNKYIPSGQDSLQRSTKVKNICKLGTDMSVNAKGKSLSYTPLKQDENHTKNNLAKDSKNKKEKQDKEEDNKECNKKDIEKCNETGNKKYNEEDDKESQKESKESFDSKKENNQDEVDVMTKIGNQTQPLNKHSVLTWYNHRRSLPKRRMSVNKKFVSLAEAVSRYQNETPKRFHTRSNKANNITSIPLSKLTQNRLKPTIPISPALISKNRSRPVKVLSQEEREKLEMEEMKKHRIKANPIPSNVLRSSRVIKKPMTATDNSTIESNEKVSSTNLSQLNKSPLSNRDKASCGPKNVKLLVTNSSGLIVEREEVTFFGVPKDINATKNVTRIVPFSFEARNKDLQIKKKQRLKDLQEASKTKTEFHARPVPNFSKPPTPPAKQQQSAKKSILPCPFSFDDRDKRVSVKKEQLVKQLLEEDKRARVFRANPVPVFKPVMIRGRSKENLSAKNKNMKIVNEQVEDQENKEPNIDSFKAERKNIEKAKNTVGTIDKQKVPLKAYPFKLNTDKRAKERCEFNEKMRRKEMEEAAKRQEVEKKKLESEKLVKTELRKLTEVKARPMPLYKSPVIIKGTKKLTDPESPAFASKLKSKQT
ncbi:PREDICTED: targeting protein for Xklp2 [Cyphomyrmex costatus]|uniref:Targeting protein for Xklp2 n=1 Tax=Cyphomyrmex costatus TaxID=456900 RepID=A0A151I7G0_9HYME|nr:PREDICTED: targeting protein for Xklp2 [Cyphomyrmex costatus]XP_018405373.1 PREDICTED: targeting protein for Xklp2 [Cyphomyrmex costatus]KYM93897.1 Targeting protein for Xklp2 [Cyphomyrmex costatus]